MNIVILNPLGMVGGAERCLLDVVEATRAARPSWRVHAVLGGDGPLVGALEALGASVAVMPLPRALAGLGDAGASSFKQRLALGLKLPAAGAFATGYARRLRRLCARLAPDIVYSNGLKTHALSAFAAPSSARVVWHLHDFLEARPVASRLLRRLAGRRLTVVGVSDAVARDARRVLDGRPCRVAMIHNRVHCERFAPGLGDPDALDRAAALPPAPADTVRVGMVATYARWKGHDVYLDAVRKLADNLLRPCRFYIVGGPIYETRGSQWTRAELQARIDDLGLTGRVGLTGFQADPASVYRSLDVVVHASTAPEPFGRVIVEAQACGRALVATNGGGAAELVIDGENALACRPGDSEALAAAAARLVIDPDLRRRLGASARRSACLRFHHDGLATEWLALWEGSASTRPETAPSVAANVFEWEPTS